MWPSLGISPRFRLSHCLNVCPETAASEDFASRGGWLSRILSWEVGFSMLLCLLIIGVVVIPHHGVVYPAEKGSACANLWRRFWFLDILIWFILVSAIYRLRLCISSLALFKISRAFLYLRLENKNTVWSNSSRGSLFVKFEVKSFKNIRLLIDKSCRSI